MKNHEILFFGKSLFWLSFILGNICLFGFLLTKNEEFAGAGFILLNLGGIINFLVFLVLIIYGVCRQEVSKACNKAAFILLINIPVAVLYAWIGLEIL